MNSKVPDVRLTARGGVWKDLSDLVSVVVDEASFKIGADGLHVTEVDPAHVALIDVQIPSSSFESYEVPFESRLGMDLDNLKALIRVAGDRSITLRHVPKENDPMLIELSMPGHRWTFGDLEDGRFHKHNIPDLALPVRFHVPASFIQDANGIGMCLADNVTVTYHDQDVTLDYETDGGSSSSQFVKAGMVKGRARSAFPLDYITSFFRVLDGQVMLEVQLGNDYPVCVTGETANGVRFRYFLAPRVTTKG